MSSVSALTSTLLPVGSPALASLSISECSRLIVSLARLRPLGGLPQAWIEAVLKGPLDAELVVGPASSTRRIAEVAWAVSELCEASAGGRGSIVARWASEILAAAAAAARLQVRRRGARTRARCRNTTLV
jgi:hypothetical protein